MAKPFFYRIDAGDLINFATDPEGENVTLLQFGKALQKGESDVRFIQSIIDEANQYIEKKRVSGSKGGKAKASTAVAPLENALAKASTAVANSSAPLASSSNSSSNIESKEKDCKEQPAFFDSEKRLRECVAEKMEFLESNYPSINIAEEVEELVAKYRSTTIGADPWLLVLRWIKNVKPKQGVDNRPGYVYGRDPKPEMGTPEYKIWRECHARACL